MKCEDIVFNSDGDDWNYGTSFLNERIIVKKEMVAFVIEDEEREIIGFYFNNTLLYIVYWQESDENSFEFNFYNQQ